MAWLNQKKLALLSDLEFLKLLPTSPGVYRMYDAGDVLIYVGKARNLKKRVSQYFQNKQHDRKTTALVAKIARVDYTIVESEIDALLLESNLIKHHQPKYNILLRDDKSYPYLYLSTQHRFPRLDFVRGKKYKQGRYFGPYPTGASAKETLNLLQRCFLIRQCRDSYFNHRSRPCLQYQIKRCKAPCVDLISESDYQCYVDQAVAFLEGKSDDLIAAKIQAMTQAAKEQAYEKAAIIRDQIELLRQLQGHQYISHDDGDADVLSLSRIVAEPIMTIVFVRQGKVLGHRDIQCKQTRAATVEQCYQQFIAQYYLGEASEAVIPARIVLPITLKEKLLYQQALSQQAQRKVRLINSPHEPYKTWLQMAQRNAEQALLLQQSASTKVAKQLDALAEHLGQEKNSIKRIECFDVSHSHGEATKASCVVFGQNGADKKAYRQYNIKGVMAGDDYAAMRQALYRRFKRLSDEGASLPDVVLIDGGKGQLRQAMSVFDELHINDVILIAVAKGVSRKPGLEKLIMPGGCILHIPPFDPALHLIQFIRDESHRFGIKSHRNKRDNQRKVSPLEMISGIGPKKRQALLEHFGGLQGLKKASSQEIAKVQGITFALAEKVRAALQ